MSSDGSTTSARRGRPRDAGKDEAILTAAGGLFMERGFEAASLDAVAQTAGVSKATIYARYPDKDALFTAVLRHECETVVTPASFAPDPQRPVRETLIHLAERFLDLVLGQKAMRMHRVIVAEASRAPRLAELFFETAVLSMKDRFAAWLAAETAAGRLSVRDPEGAAWRYLGAVKGEAHMRGAYGMPPIPADQLQRHVAVCADEFLMVHGPKGHRASE